MQENQRPSGGLREAKKRITRRQLTSTARRLSLAHGLDSVTVEMICAEVGVSVRTFFNYFESKDDSVVGEQRPLGDEQSRATFTAGGPTGDLMSDLLVLLDPSEPIDAEGREEFTVAFALFMREPKLLARQLTRGIEQEEEVARLVAARHGLPATDPSSATVAAIAGTVLRRGVVDWIEAADDEPLSAHINRSARSAVSLLSSTPKTAQPGLPG